VPLSPEDPPPGESSGWITPAPSRSSSSISGTARNSGRWAARGRQRWALQRRL